MVATRECAGNVGEGRLASLFGFEPVGQICSCAATTRRQRTGHSQHNGALVLCCRFVNYRGIHDWFIDCHVGGHVFLDHDVRVGSAETETGNTGDGLAGVTRPVGGLGRHLQVRLLEVDVRVRAQVVDRRGNLVFLHRQNDLDQAGGARSCFQVPEVGLRTTEQSRLVVVTATTDDTAERVGLDGITEIGTRSVRLDVVDCGRHDAGVAVRETQHVGLGVRVGREQTVGNGRPG